MNELNKQRYVSRGGDKLASVAGKFNLDFRDKVVLDVGSSTGGFTDFALQNGASKVFAIELGTNQLHPKLRQDKRIELHEKTDIRDIILRENKGKRAAGGKVTPFSPRDEKNRRFVSITVPDVVVIDVSFISLREILPSVLRLSGPNTLVVALLKPQFETSSAQKHDGIVKNDRIRRQIFKNFEEWVRQYCALLNKADSGVTGATGNKERFYLLKHSQ